MLGSRRLIHLLLAVAVVGLGFAAYVAVGPPAAAKAPTTTATVRRGVVLSSVSATGNVSPATQLGLNFQNSGTVSEIDVAVGQHVTAGQVLARIQNQTQQEAVSLAQINLTSAQIKLKEAQAPTGATAAQQQAALTSGNIAVTTAQDSVTAAQQTAAMDATTQAASVAAAQTKLTNDQQNVSALQAADQAQLAADQETFTADQAPGSSYQQKITTDTNNQSSACGINVTLCTNDQATLLTDQATLAQKLAADQSKIVADQQKIQTDGALLTTDQTALTNAQNTQQATATKDQQAITSAQNQLANAQATLASTKAGQITDPATLTSDQAAVTSAQQQLTSAQLALTQTALTAPVAGTVGAINGTVGQTATGSNSSSSSSTSSSSTSSAGAAGSGFISLTDLSSLQIVAGFSETDASKIIVGQPATVTFNALTGVNLQGKVTEININSVTVSNVVTYNVTVSILDAPSTLKPGMTANLSVTSAEKDNVLELPSSAISASGNTATVQVLQPDGKTIVTKTITIGMRGDTNDEITSGLNAGDKVVVTLAGARSTSLTSRAGLPGIGGGLGGGLGGGAAVRIGGGG